MHLSKGVLYVGIIAYSGAMLLFFDWPAQTAATGTANFAWLAKVLVDVAFIGLGLIRLLGPALFAEDEADDEVAIHEEDLHISDTALYGAFLLNVLGNAGFHAYMTSQVTGAESVFFTFVFVAEVLVLILTWVMWTHAIKAQKRAAQRARAQSNPRRVA